MTEAVRALLVYGFHALSEALIHPQNSASIRLVQRLGFRCEGGALGDGWRADDRYISVMMYGLMRSTTS
jgi:ribosomal-protein-alanine N-acetyltransferase